jgi:hypothetical protein
MKANQTLPAAGQAEQLLLFTDVLTIRVPQATTHGQYAIFEEEVPPLGGLPPIRILTKKSFTSSAENFSSCSTT